MTDRLTAKKDWSEKWQDVGPMRLEFDPTVPLFRDVHRLLVRTLPRTRNLKFLEIGCYPGNYMWYFHEYFGYEVSGIEYVDWCARAVEATFAAKSIKARVFDVDLFKVHPGEIGGPFDVVFSSGFVEHFEDTEQVLLRHKALCAPNGIIVILLPNHAGIYGSIMKRIAPSIHKMHNLMNGESLFDAASAVGLESVSQGYAGRIGLWNTCLYETARAKGKAVYALVRIPGWLLERCGRILPNTPLLSPNIYYVGFSPASGQEPELQSGVSTR